MGLPIRTDTEIQLIINKSQHALASLGADIVKEKKRGVKITNRDHRDKVYRLILLRAYLQNILEPDGSIFAYYLSSTNTKKFNNILDGLVSLSKGFDGPAIPLLGQVNIPLLFYPGTSGQSSSSGGGQAQPGGTVFQGTANSPSTLIDTFNASISSFVFYIVSIAGNNSGEGTRTSLVAAAWRGSNEPLYNETRTEDVGGTTAPVTLKVELVGGKIQLNAYTTTNNWTITGVRILFQNISFVNPIGPLPAGGSTHQLLRKTNSLDYQVEWFTLTAAAITDLLASATELNFSQGVTSPIQVQLDALQTALASYLLLTGGTMAGNIAMNGHKVTGLAAAVSSGEALRYEQVIGLYLLLTGGTMSGPIAMGGNKITGLAAATSNGDAVRYEQLADISPLITRVVDIGDWNMDTTSSVLVVLGVTYSKIRSVKVSIRSDDLSGDYQLSPLEISSGLLGGWWEVNFGILNPLTINLNRVNGGFYDNTNYNQTSYNRGWIVIEHIP